MTPQQLVQKAAVVACGHCKRRLQEEFFFTCRKCHASYCYIHMARHSPSACARHARPRKVPATPPMSKDPIVMLAGSSQMGCSANV